MAVEPVKKLSRPVPIQPCESRPKSLEIIAFLPSFSHRTMGPGASEPAAHGARPGTKYTPALSSQNKRKLENSCPSGFSIQTSS
jgi:hypothetical protein